MYADDSLEVTDERLEHVAAQGILLAVERLKAYRWSPDINDYEILVGWKGLHSIENSYEPLHLSKEIRVLVENYVTRSNDRQLNIYWRNITENSPQTLASVTQPTETSPPPNTSEPGAPSRDGEPTRRRTAGKKMRHRQPVTRAVTVQEDKISQQHPDALADLCRQAQGCLTRSMSATARETASEGRATNTQQQQSRRCRRRRT
ncbi:unnamed protein product [Phytophthora fragariaefolia]|uniref:Unnamed protein product n=1 Tax=Phytophthora fragariaefolia TaxID=1490495 RepID=A0A9W6XD43_9STRA|nr:unnamed protein product [Phytophthora fragariaefolia]